MLSAVQQAAIERATAKYAKHNLPPRAALVAEFIETYCTYTKGGYRGKPFMLMDWQLECLAGIYRGLPYESREITRALISLARKGGKTELGSALVVVHLCGPEAGVGEEIICAAPGSQEQAGISWQGAKIMTQNHPALAKHMTYRLNRIIYKLGKVDNYALTISTKPSTAQGKIPALFTYDEIAEAKTRDLYEALDYAQVDTKTGGLGVIISTRSTEPDSLFTTLHDEAVIGQQNGINKHWFVKVYSADITKPLYTMKQVERANPSMKYGMPPREKLERDLQNAISNVSARAGFNARVLNIHTGKENSLVDPQLWVDAAERNEPVEWEEIRERFKGERVSMGLDLGKTLSMTSIALYFYDHRYVVARNWIAKSQVKKNTTLHKAPYGAWGEAGYVGLIDNAQEGGMSYEPIAAFIAQCFKDFDVKAFRYDEWKIDRLRYDLKLQGLDMERMPMVKVVDRFHQGAKDYTPAIDEFEDLMVNGRLTHDGNPVTTMSMNFCQTKSINETDGDTKKPVKKNGLPNDAACAILMAISTRDRADNDATGIGDDLIEGITGQKMSDHASDGGGSITGLGALFD